MSRIQKAVRTAPLHYKVSNLYVKIMTFAKFCMDLFLNPAFFSHEDHEEYIYITEVGRL